MTTKALPITPKSLPEIGQMLETENGALVSGFSATLSPGKLLGGLPPINIVQCNCTNNCQGANCVSGCGK